MATLSNYWYQLATIVVGSGNTTWHFGNIPAGVVCHTIHAGAVLAPVVQAVVNVLAAGRALEPLRALAVKDLVGLAAAPAVLALVLVAQDAAALRIRLHSRLANMERRLCHQAKKTRSKILSNLSHNE